MKMILANSSEKEDFYILNMGFEDVSENAHWGKGFRNMYIIHYVLEGEGYFNSVKIKAGEGFFISSGSVHEYHSSKDFPWKYFWIAFGGEAAYDIVKKYV